MKTYKLDFFGDIKNKDLCSLLNFPEKFEKPSLFRDGLSLEGHISESATIKISDNAFGQQLESFVSHEWRILILHKDVVNEIKKIDSSQSIEYYPLIIKDLKNKVISNSYFIVHTTSIIDALDCGLSEMKISRASGKVRSIEKFVMKAVQIKNAPPIFRIPELKKELFFNEELFSIIREKEFTNFYFEEIDCAN